MAKKKIFLAGYYGFGNLGDEILLRLYQERLREKFDLFVLGVDFNRWSPVAIFRRMSRCDALVFGGGGILQDKSGPLSFWYYLALIFLARALRVPVVLLSQGVGPLAFFNRAAASRALQGVSRMTVRDRESLDVIPDCPARLSADSAHLWNCPPKKTASKILIIPRGLETPDAWGKISEALAAVSKREGAPLEILAFHPSHDAPVLELLGKLFGGEARLLSWSRPEEALAHMASAGWVISARYHGLIFAALMGIPFAAVASDPKINSYLNEFDFKPGEAPLLREATFEEADRLWSSRAAAASVVSRRLPELTARARADFEWLESL